MKSELLRLWRVIPKPRLHPMLVVIFLLIASSLSEGLSAAAIIPLLLALMGKVPIGWSVTSLVICFSFVVLFTGIVRFSSLALSNRLAADVGSDLAELAFTALLDQPFPQLLATPPSKITALLAPQLRQVVNGVLLPVLQLLSSSILFISLSFVLLALAWVVVFPTLLFMLFVYGILSYWVRPRLKNNAELIVSAQQNSIKLIQQTFSGLRELRLLGLGSTRVSMFASLDRMMRHREAENITIGGLPRFVLEPTMMVAIALVGALFIAHGVSPIQILPQIGLLAYGAQRLLPLAQQLWSAWSSLSGCKAVLMPLLLLIEQPQQVSSSRDIFNFMNWKMLELCSISYQHTPSSRPLLKKFNFSISPGEWLALVGPSGSGKSTALDLLMGLLQPDSGQLLLDGNSLTIATPLLSAWQRGIAYVGHQPPLFGFTVRQAVQAEINCEPAFFAAAVEITEITDLLDRPLGERGQALSSGQLQRVGLARALASNPKLLILDEATSALDTFSELKILKCIQRIMPSLSVVLVSHRPDCLIICNRTINMLEFI